MQDSLRCILVVLGDAVNTLTLIRRGDKQTTVSKLKVPAINPEHYWPTSFRCLLRWCPDIKIQAILAFLWHWKTENLNSHIPCLRRILEKFQHMTIDKLGYMSYC